VTAPAHVLTPVHPARSEPVAPERRAALVRRGLLLNRLSLTYNVVEAGLALAAGMAAGSVALVAFGADSVIEVGATLAAGWRLAADGDAARRARVERRALRAVGVSFLALAAYVAAESAATLWRREAPDASPVGVALLTLSAGLMPVLARAKRKVARALGSGTLEAEATQTALCAWLSVIALAGVVLNAALGWWWADAAAALGMVPIIAREGWDAVRGRATCAECGGHGHAASGFA
jgi:divalent metal cation (Fe/Co/Zn/Cd) transporter